MVLNALTYCERQFYLEEVEGLEIADQDIYAGRTLHEELKQEEEEDGGEWTSMEISSEKLGLVGKVDALRRRDGVLIPYEHKKGRPKRDGKMISAWKADAVQVSAYAMMLEEQTGQPVAEGRIRYHAENITVRVAVDEEMRQSVINAIKRARELIKSIDRPPVTKNDRMCIRCSLAPVCLPEEERFVDDEHWEPVRMFPEDREVKTLHITDNGAYISRSGDMLKVLKTNGEENNYPIHEIGTVVLHGYPQITTQAIHFCARNEIPIHWISAGGNYIAGLAPDSGGVQRRIRQYKALNDEKFCLSLAKKLTIAKVQTALRYILRATRDSGRDNKEVEKSFTVMRGALRNMGHSSNIDELRGYEGVSGRAYFEVLPLLLKKGLPDEFRFNGRNRRPPKDRFNALLGFGYSMLYQEVLQAVIITGLDPSFGFYHTPRSAAHPLVLDVMELFRVILWDMPLIGSLNRMQWDKDTDFEITPGRVWLSAAGRKKAIALFEDRLEETWKHPVVNYSLSYARLVELEVRLLEKEWSGKPGLFAKMRIR
ncbi:MAG: type I-MYXAN CRISPR-associated endonuclease Cas1 [Candidatus Goldbacteria bacterium]|nr:type I-MYXAN CRISPR-associated endonuclease Cas1 [Candidatus Goldiibacteriota bacterium]